MEIRRMAICVLPAVAARSRVLGCAALIACSTAASWSWAAEADYPGRVWVQVAPRAVGMDKDKLDQARYYALAGGGAGIVTRHGKMVMAWRDNAYRPSKIQGIPRREFGSGISANVDAMSRIGLLYLREGEWSGDRIIPTSFVRLVQKPVPQVVGLPEFTPTVSRHASVGDASAHYGLLWWNNADATLKKVPRDTYWAWGLYDSLIVVIPSLDIVVARAGQSFEGDRSDHYGVLRPFLEPIARSVAGPSAYQPADRMVAARVPTDRCAYQFFERLDGGSGPVWTSDIERRGTQTLPVVPNPATSPRIARASVRRRLWHL